MKTIKRIISWVVDKSIYLLIGIKDFTPTLVPDDWSPDGSMHFLCFDHPIGSTGLPPNAVQYEFAANVGEDDPVVFSLGQEMISHLCDSRKTLIVFSFDPVLSNYERKKATVPHSETVAQFLHSLIPAAPLTQKENMIACLDIGYPKELFSKYQASSAMPYCFIDVYLFPEETISLHPEEGLSLVENGKYQANLYLDYGPNALNIVFNSKLQDIAEIEMVIKDVCHNHNIQLINPFPKTT
jgi:hypothetical protein